MGPRAPERWFDKPVEPQRIESDKIAVRAEPSLDRTRTRLALCTHESAHAIAFLRYGVVPTKIWARNGKGECNVPSSKMFHFDNIICVLAGEAADLKFFGKQPNLDSHDRTVSKKQAAIREAHTKVSPEQTIQECWQAALQLVDENEVAIRALGKLLYEESELSGTEVEIVAGLCQPRKAARADDVLRTRPGILTAARSGVPEFTDPNDPLTQKLYGRAVAFWSEYHAR
jgi:hypothetical protein